MSEPIILSDEEEDHYAFSTPSHSLSKKPRSDPDPNPTVLVIEDDPTPQKSIPNSTPLVIPDTPVSVLSNSEVSIVKCTAKGSSVDVEARASIPEQKFSGINKFICVESDYESESGSRREDQKENETTDVDFDVVQDVEWRSGFIEPTRLHGDHNVINVPGSSYSHITFSEDAIHQVYGYPDKENTTLEQTSKLLKEKATQINVVNKHSLDGAMGKQKISKEDRTKLMEEKKQKKEQEKLQKAALKAEAAELKRQQKERQKWENGKFALKSIVAEIDSKVLELQTVGGPLLSRFAEKGLTYRIKSNPIERSIIWTMNVPEHMSQILPNVIEIPYVLLVCEAEEICNLVANDTLLDHVSRIRSRYPSHTVCYLINRLMTYINKREKEQYKNPSSNTYWRCPPVEEVRNIKLRCWIMCHGKTDHSFYPGTFQALLR